MVLKLLMLSKKVHKSGYCPYQYRSRRTYLGRIIRIN